MVVQRTTCTTAPDSCTRWGPRRQETANPHQRGPADQTRGWCGLLHMKQSHEKIRSIGISNIKTVLMVIFLSASKSMQNYKTRGQWPYRPAATRAMINWPVKWCSMTSTMSLVSICHLHIAYNSHFGLWDHSLSGLRGHIWPQIWNQ